jgi:hypothetical protein
MAMQRAAKASWTERYGATHQWKRVNDFPAGIERPRKVRLYQRAGHYLLNWWDPEQKKNLSERIDGDLLEALMRARAIDERVVNYRRSGAGQRKLTHELLVDHFLEYQSHRAEAGEIDHATVDRYRTALGHYMNFVGTNSDRKWSTVNRIDEDFALQFAVFLRQLEVSPNGHANTARRRLRSPEFVQSVVRSMLRWAAASNAGALLGDGFRNPFQGRIRKTESVHADLFGEPDITLDMASEFLRACDEYQLPVFTLLVFYGLRPSELSFAFRESLTEDWLSIICRPELAYFTKGRRDKRLPLIDPVRALLSSQRRTGLVFHNRLTAKSQITPTLKNLSVEELAGEFSHRCDSVESRDFRKIRDQVIRNAGGLNYDRIEHEFHKIARQLNWPQLATLKDFRHLFNTSMQNAGMPEFYRRYLLGQSPGRSALVNYTHLNDLRNQYERAVNTVYRPLLITLDELTRNQACASPVVTKPPQTNQTA